MFKAIRVFITFSIALLFVFSLVFVGCKGGPSEEELQLLEETKSAALAAEQKLADCESNKSDLENQLSEKKRELENVKQEQRDVSKRLAAMEN
jgi:chromosome segregation ATPase